MKRVKLFALIILLFIGLGHAWGEDFSTTYDYAGISNSTWYLTNGTDQKGYWQVPSGNDPSVATLPGVFTGKTVTSDVIVTINCATYGNGTNPSASTFSLHKKDACTDLDEVTATQSGTLPTSSTYTDVTYTVATSDAAGFVDDLYIKITKPGKTIRLKSIKVEFTYTTSGVTYTDYLTECPAVSEYSVSNTLYGLESANGNPTTVEASAKDLTLNYTAKTGYSLNTDNISVKVGSTELTDAEYVYSDGELLIEPSAGFKGNVVVTIYAKLQEPTNVKATAESTTVTITWTQNSKATDYIISYTAGGDIIPINTGNVNTYTIKGLTPNTVYACTIRAIDGNTPKTDSQEADAHFTTTALKTYTITWNVNGSTTTTSVTEGNAVVLPATPASCSDIYTHFVGWFTTPAGSDSNPDATAPATQVTAATVPTGDDTYYAVFSDADVDETDYSSTYTTGTNVPLSGGTSSKVKINSTDYDAQKAGTVSAAGSITIKVPAGTMKLYFHLAGWNGEGSKTITVSSDDAAVSLSPSSFTTIADAGISGSTTTYTLSGTISNYSNLITLSNVTKETTLTFANGGKDQRFVIWGANVNVGTPATGYISSCCSDPEVVTIEPVDNTLNLGADGNATTAVSCSRSGGAGTGGWTYSVSPKGAGANFDGTTFTATKAGTYTLTATYTENCGKSAKTIITVTATPTLYFTTEPDDPIVFDDPKCGGNTPLDKKKSVALQGYNLTGDVTVTVSGDYKIARISSATLQEGYSTSLTLDKTKAGKIDADYQTIYILSTPPAAKTDATEGTLTITTEGGNPLTVNLSTPTITCSEYTLTFMDQGGKYKEFTQYAGTDVAEPTAPTGVCTEPINYVFDGWAEASVDEGSTTYTKVTFPYTMPKNGATLYAVYRYSEGEQTIFTAGSSGDFLIYAKEGEISHYAIGGVSDNQISTTTDVTKASAYTVTALGNDIYTIQYGSSYIGKTDGDNVNLTANATNATWNQWKITSSSKGKGTWRVTSVLKENRGLIYTSNCLKAYATSNVITTGNYYDLEIGGSNILYTSDPACGPHIGLMGDVRITSAKDVRVDAYTKITVSGTNLNKNTGGNGGTATAVSIKATSNNAKFKIKRWGTTGDGNDVYSGNDKSWAFATNIQTATYTDSLCITYTPTEFNAFDTATITLTAYRYNGTTPYATKTITVLGHSLPERFVIAAKGTDGWVALPNTLGSNSSANVPGAEDINGYVDPTDNPTKLNTAPSNVIYTAAARADSYKNYSQTGLRFTVDGGQFLQASKNETKVWLSTTGSQDMQSWTLRTEDFTDYVVRIDSGSLYNRSLSYYKDATTERIGHYTTNTAIRFLPFDAECTRLLAPANLKVTQVNSSAITLAWDAVAGAIGYAYSTDGGSTWTEMGNVLTYTITGLDSEMAYTILVKGVVPLSDTDCSYYGTVLATTTNCDDVPQNISYTSDVNSITLSWTMTSATAIVQVYSDNAGRTQVGSDHTGATSPYTIKGLAKATTYYVKILAGGSCSSELVEVSTERPQLDVVEWKSNGIDVAINTNEKISVILENQVTKGTGTGLIANALFFSKYFEATSNVKLIAVYNGTGHDVDVTNYTIKYGKTGWESGYIKLGNFTKVANTMAAGEEVILYSKGNADEDNVIMNCVSTAYPDAPWQQVTNGNSGNSGGNGLLSFAGDKTIALYNGTTLLDVIGAITEEGFPTNTGASMKEPSWGDAKGWTCDTGLSIEDGTEIGISTNRCLLVRKNTVKSGANAVAQNTADFATLCNEWLGQHVPHEAADNGVQASCDNFAYVGTFNYSDYYTTYDLLKETVFDNSERNDDGTFTIEIPRMDTLACKGLKIVAKDKGGNVLTTKDYKVPILVTTSTNTADKDLFRFGGDTCKTCDVVVRDKATLTKATDGTANDKPQVRDIKIYEGASLIVPEGTNYTVHSLSLRRKEDVVSAVDVAGTLNINSTSDKPVYLDLRINAENWHWFTLPYNCAIADVTWSNGQPAVAGKDWRIATYNGKKRAETQAGGCWEDYTGDTIHAGQGFIVGIKGDGNDKHAYELRFPMAKEVITAEKENKDVAGMKAYGAGTAIRPNHKGWNLVGNPYLNYYKRGNINSFGGLQLSELIYDPVTGWWSLKGDNLPYMVIPQNFGWSAYEQVLVSSRDLEPFTAYFIQVGKDNDTGEKEYSVNFTSDNRGKSLKAALMTSAAEEAEEEPVITGIVLRNAQGEQDETSLVIAERFDSTYEMGADFFKWFGDYYRYYTRPVLYSIGDDGGKRAFNAVNEEGAKQSIPLGMYAARDGQYTLSLNTRSDLSRVDKVWLYDAESGLHTDLLREDYTFATTRTESSGRFFLSVVLKEKEITTGADNARYGDLSLYADKQTLVVCGLPEEAEVWVYDPSGKLLHHEQTHHYERQYEVPQQGTYLVRVESQDGGVTLRGICR